MKLLDFHRQSPEVRTAGVADAEAIARVQLAAWLEAYRGLVPDPVLDTLTLTELRSGWRQWIEAEPEARLTLVAQGKGGEVIGFASIGPSRDLDVDPAVSGELYAFYVAPSHWRRGVGARLLRRAVEELAARRYLSADLWVLSGNARGRAFYEAQGWSLEGTTKGCFDGSVPAVRYRRALRPA